MTTEIEIKSGEQVQKRFSVFGKTLSEHNAFCDSLKDENGNYPAMQEMVQKMKRECVAPPKSVCVWKGEGVIHAERVMNYQLQRIRNERCIVEGCHARKFKSGMCKRHSKVVQ